MTKICSFSNFLAFILIIQLFHKSHAFSRAFTIQDFSWLKKALQGLDHNDICGRQPWKIIQPHFQKRSSGRRVKRIVGGEDADFGEWPWKVKLTYPTGYHKCGGALLNK